ncbi:DUF3054 domain-containing protein [Mycobacterium montefiorense]|uniref:DUF3054 domain-containing protein n=2 Tax=Mycobacterium montefiorense TaxID=154654 RepID=UPI0021F2D8FA|nr:DUF3054 domain-containing protein [Mycobacterium montefiorense]MCV7429001.1 DUF3054 domain-containing protein [Mycobacterium montefiorense]
MQRLGWLSADVVSVLVFCAIGRSSHAEGITIVGLATTVWPFLTGTVVGWLLSRAWQRPTAVVPTGLIVWVCTVAIGMLLRRVTSAAVTPGFLLVASVFTALLLVGWRVAVGLTLRRRSNV